MEQIVTITRQGQLTIPRAVRSRFGMTKSTKAILRTDGQTIIVEPKTDFWSLSGSLHSGVKLTLAQLRRAHRVFAKDWAERI